MLCCLLKVPFFRWPRAATLTCVLWRHASYCSSPQHTGRQHHFCRGTHLCPDLRFVEVSDGIFPAMFHYRAILIFTMLLLFSSMMINPSLLKKRKREYTTFHNRFFFFFSFESDRLSKAGQGEALGFEARNHSCETTWRWSLTEIIIAAISFPLYVSLISRNRPIFSEILTARLRARWRLDSVRVQPGLPVACGRQRPSNVKKRLFFESGERRFVRWERFASWRPKRKLLAATKGLMQAVDSWNFRVFIYV